MGHHIALFYCQHLELFYYQHLELKKMYQLMCFCSHMALVTPWILISASTRHTFLTSKPVAD